MMKSFLYKARFSAFIALTLVAQLSFAADHAGGDKETLDRYKNKFPEFATVMSLFTKWSEKDNEGKLAELSKEEHLKQAEWQGNALWLRGKIDASCKPASDPASQEMAWMLDYCFSWTKNGADPAATYRLVVNGLKEKDDDEVALAMREVNACRTALADMFKWKRAKVKESSEFKSELEMEKKIDNFFAKLEEKFDNGDVKTEEVTPGEEKIAKHKKAFQAALKETKVENLCRFVNDPGGAGARPSPSPSASPTPTVSPAASNAQGGTVWKDKNGNNCTPPAWGCEKVTGSYAKPPVAIAQPSPYSAVQPPFTSPVIPNYGPANYDPCGYSGCGGVGYGGGYAGGGYVPSAAPGVPGYVAPPFFPAQGGGGFQFGYASGPRPVAPPPPPPPLPYPMGPPPPPVMFAQGGSVSAGGDMPTVTKVETVTVSKTTPISSPTPMPSNMMGFMNRCMKAVCPPAFGMMAMTQRFPMGIQPINGFIPRNNIPPSVTPYYPGTTPGSYGPIATTPVVTTTNPTSPWVNPTFYGTPNTQYQQIPSTRDRIGRV